MTEWTQVPPSSGGFNPVSREADVFPDASTLPIALSLDPTEYTVGIKLIGGVATYVRVLNTDAASTGVSKMLPPAPAPPPGVFEVGNWLLNDSPSAGSVLGWIWTVDNRWSQLGAIVGPSVVVDPTAYTVAIIGPTAGATLAAVQRFSLQCGSGMVYALLRDSNGTGPILGQGLFVNHAIAFDVVTTGLAAGAHTIVALAYDTPPDQFGLFPTASHVASYSLDVVVAVQVTAPTPSPAPAPSPSPAPTPTPTPTPSGFVPSDVTELKIWFELDDAANEVHSGGLESQLTDKIGADNNAVQATGANQPAYQATGLGGKPCIYFDGTGAKVMSIAAAAAINNMWAGGGTLIAVLSAESDGGASGAGRIFDKGTWYAEFNHFGLFAFVVKFGGNIYYWSVQTSTQFAFGTPLILRIDYNSDAIANVPAIYFNGVQHSIPSGTASQPTGGTMDSDAAFPLLIGNSQAGDKQFHGRLGAFLDLPTTPSSTNGDSLLTYESTKWAITSSGGGVTPSPSPSPSPSVSYDLPSAAIPGVVVLQGQGLVCQADYTFGSSAGTIKTLLANGAVDDLFTYFQTAYIYGNYTQTRLNDEWEFFKRVYAANQMSIDGAINANTQTHVMATDHLKLRCSIDNISKFNAMVAICRASSVPVDPDHPDGHDWGSWQDGSRGVVDCGVRSGMISALRFQKNGYFEFKVQGTTAAGSWWAGWNIDSALGGWPPEVDVFELVNNNAPDNSFRSFHGLATNNIPRMAVTDVSSQLSGGSYQGGFDQAAAPVIYGCRWTDTGDARGHLWELYVNQVLVRKSYYPWISGPTGLPSGPAAWMIDHAFGGNWPGRGGAATDPATFPRDVLVYYFRMFQ